MIKNATYLLAALAQKSEFGDVWLCVVDPGVGERLPVVLDCGGVTFVGPNNGLFELIHRRVNGATQGRLRGGDIMSATFHGRDLLHRSLHGPRLEKMWRRRSLIQPSRGPALIGRTIGRNHIYRRIREPCDWDRRVGINRRSRDSGGGPDNEICAHILRCSRRQIVLASELNGPHRDRCKSRTREPNPRSAGRRFD